MLEEDWGETIIACKARMLDQSMLPSHFMLSVESCLQHLRSDLNGF